MKDDKPCISCESSEMKRKTKNIETIKEKARQWAQANGYTGELVIVSTGGRYGFRKPDCPCFNEADAPEKLESIYIS